MQNNTDDYETYELIIDGAYVFSNEDVDVAERFLETFREAA